MAADPAFASIPRAASALLGAAETNLQVPTTTSTVLTAGASGTKIEEIVVQAAGAGTTTTTVAGNVYIFLHDGTTYHLFDIVPVTAVSGTTTVAAFRASNRYVNLWIPTAWSIRASQSIAGNASLLKITVHGADY